MFAVFMTEMDYDGKVLDERMVLNSRRDSKEDAIKLVHEMNDMSIDELGIWRNETDIIRLEVHNLSNESVVYSWPISFV